MILYLKKELAQKADAKKAKVLSGFFKTGKGQYGEGDEFLGIPVPQTRAAAKKYSGMSLAETGELLGSKIHEERLAALLVLVEKFRKGNEEEKAKIFDFYIGNAKKVNNWDLVDLSADKIAGEYLFGKDASALRKLAKSGNLWERRIAIISTFAFIRRGSNKETFRIAELLISDEQDLIHKAVGWMLREAGKRGKGEEVKFLKKHCKKMPRTMLRYSIEKFSQKERKGFMQLGARRGK